MFGLVREGGSEVTANRANQCLNLCRRKRNRKFTYTPIRSNADGVVVGTQKSGLALAGKLGEGEIYALSISKGTFRVSRSTTPTTRTNTDALHSAAIREAPLRLLVSHIIVCTLSCDATSLGIASFARNHPNGYGDSK